MNYLRIIRPVNLLLIILVQSLIKYAFFEHLGVQVAMSHFEFMLLVMATCCIAAAGNVINDIQDITIDQINKPNKVIVGRGISEKNAYNYYIVLTILGVGTGFWLANSLGHPGLASVFIVISVLLYMYATQLTSMLLVGNILVSLLVAMSLIVLILFDIFPAITTTDEMAAQVRASQIVLGYATFAFYINLIRELVKDLEDIDGDKNGNRNTLPIAIGRQRTTWVTFVFGVIAMLVVLGYTYIYLSNDMTFAFYAIFLIAGPLLLFCIKAWSAENKSDYKQLSLLLKIIFLSGICSLLFYY